MRPGLAWRVQLRPPSAVCRICPAMPLTQPSAGLVNRAA